MNFFTSEHFQQQNQTLQNIQKFNFEKILFPEFDLTTDGDKWFKWVWKQIDNANSHIWIITYAFDSSFTANLTLLKLIDARKRGVNCVLYVDDLQQYVDKQLIQEFQKVGGKFQSLNPTYRHIYRGNIPTQEFFRRHHEKLIIIDNFSNIGSSNFQQVYGGYKYGTYEFYDLNLIMKNANLKIIRNHFLQIANHYYFKLSDDKNQNNEEIIEKYNQLFPDSKFIAAEYKFFKTHQPKVREIQQEVIKMIDGAEKKITLIHPYYYPVKSFEKKLINALKRGVSVDLITSAKRDQPVYHYLKNQQLMKNLIQEGCNVFEVHEKLLHMKAYQIDDKHYSLGSFNNDRWSWKLNNEANINVYDDPIEVSRFDPLIDEVKQKSKIILEEYGRVGPIRYFKIKFWELFLYLSEVMMSKNKYFKREEYQYQQMINEWNDPSSTEY